MKRKALIVGSLGQDGRLLSEFLLARDYQVVGLRRGELDLTSLGPVMEKLGEVLPDEIYYLAALHHSSQNSDLNQGEILSESLRINYFGLANFLQAMCELAPTSRLFYASSSHIFAGGSELLNELTAYSPQSPYAVSKVCGMALCDAYREEKGIFASSGILFNHESPLRGSDFVSRKIAQGVARIVKTGSGTLELGDLDTEIDWGFAGDYVEAMWQIMQHSTSQNFIVATGETHSLREFVDIAFSRAGLKYQNHVVLNENTITRRPVLRRGSPKKIMAATGWKPRTSFTQLVHLMVDAELLLIDHA